MIFFLSFFLFLHSSIISTQSWAADSPSPQPSPTPTKSSDSLFKPEVTCSRSFIYRNRTYPVDSSRKLDGDGLRFVLKKNPTSESLLNSYQNQLKTSFIPAYVTTFGVALLIGGPIYSGTIKTALGQRDTRTAFVISGAALAIGGYLYGYFALHHKENTLENAVESYNDKAPPLERIQVGLTPTSSGTGGEITTVVPF